MSVYGFQDAKCPFYKDETKNSIKCEGTFCESCLQLFSSASQKKQFKERHCNTFDFKNCSHFRNVNRKY